MRLLFASTRGAGHFHPLLPFAAACVRAGHKVLFAGPPELEGPVKAAGHGFWPFADPDPEELDAVFSRVHEVSEREANRIVIGEIFGRLNTQAALPRLEQACTEWRPDVVVRDPSMFGAALAADRHGIPHARVAIGLAATEDFALGFAGETVDPDRLRATPWLTTWPEAIDPSQQPDTVRVSDPGAGASAAPLPDWWRGSDAPLVYATLGSVAGGFPTAMQAYGAILAAAEGLEARVLLTIGRQLDPAELPPVPDNVHVEAWVPQHQALAGADVALNHGGSGSVLGALAAGRPQVVVPLFADQPANAQAVARAGVGVAVTPPSPADLRAAVERVLGDAGMAAAARELAAAMAALPPVDEAVERLERIAA
jgi:UDP:flavonoid glycosyltransferase YjiC (YdhE family)